MNKSIIFILDSFELYSFSTRITDTTFCYSYFDTEEAINNKLDNIATYDIGHLSFLLERLGYDIFIGYNGYIKNIHTNMITANGKELMFGHNLRKLLIGGALNEDLGIKNTKFYYDTTMPTDELCNAEREKQIINNATKKTIDVDLSNMKIEDAEYKIKRLVDKGKKIKNNIIDNFNKGLKKVSQYLDDNK